MTDIHLISESQRLKLKNDVFQEYIRWLEIKQLTETNELETKLNQRQQNIIKIKDKLTQEQSKINQNKTQIQSLKAQLQNFNEIIKIQKSRINSQTQTNQDYTTKEFHELKYHYFFESTKQPLTQRFFNQQEIYDDLNFQIINFIQQIDELNQKISNKVQQVIKILEEIVQKNNPNAKISLYGSYNCKTNLPCSQFDIYLKFDQNPFYKQNILQELKNILEKKNCIKETYIYRKFLRFTLSPEFNDMKGEITVFDNSSLGMQCDNLTKKFLGQYEALRPLLMIVKQIIYKHQNNTPSYVIMLMIVFYFQYLQINQNPKPIEHFIQKNLSELLFGFLYFYGQDIDRFQSYVLCPFRDSNINREYMLFQNQYNFQVNGIKNNFKNLIIMDPIDNQNIFPNLKITEIKEIMLISFISLQIKIHQPYCHLTKLFVIAPRIKSKELFLKY